MSTTPTNHWKVGLFVLSGVVLALCALVFLGVESLRNEHVRYHTYFDEPVQGLDIGSPIEFRGVKVGQVADIRIAENRRHVQVVLALFTKNLRNLGLVAGSPEDDDDTRMVVPPDLRVLMALQGITGVKTLQLDFVDSRRSPAPVLPFVPEKNYIPSAPSMITKLQDSVATAVDRIPEMTDALVGMATRADRILATFEEARLAERTAGVLDRADSAFASIKSGVDAAALGKVSAQAQASFASLDATIQRANAVLARLDGETGVLASVQRTSNAIGDVVTASPALGEEVASTLREFQEAAASVRRLADALERNPDMLLKGRGQGE
jgi:phospholipid/cholesterol/gamma-HCH transport system substrate-binding protein